MSSYAFRFGSPDVLTNFAPGISYQRWPTMVESKKCSPYLSQSWPQGLTAPELSTSMTFVPG